MQGIDRCTIFRDAVDRIRFIDRVARIFGELGILVLAWALLGNHIHFVLLSTKARIGKAMQRALGPYAQSFNRRHGRVGRLFRDRFWSRPVESDEDLRGLIGYVILNPLRARIVDDLDALRTHPWTSLAELAPPIAAPAALVDHVNVLSLFGPDEWAAREALWSMLHGQIESDPGGRTFARFEPGAAGVIAERERRDLRAPSVLALRLRSETLDRALRDREAASALQRRLRGGGWTLDRVLERSARLCEVRTEHVRHGVRHRRHSQARSFVAFYAHLYLGCSDADIARVLGISRQAVATARARLSRYEGARPDWPSFFEVKDE